ncbi:TPA: hypothetical protein ACK3RK_006079 [Burkholderia cepacia]
MSNIFQAPCDCSGSGGAGAAPAAASAINLWQTGTITYATADWEADGRPFSKNFEVRLPLATPLPKGSNVHGYVWIEEVPPSAPHRPTTIDMEQSRLLSADGKTYSSAFASESYPRFNLPPLADALLWTGMGKPRIAIYNVTANGEQIFSVTAILAGLGTAGQNAPAAGDYIQFNVGVMLTTS